MNAERGVARSANAARPSSASVSRVRLLRFYGWLYRLDRWFSRRLTGVGRLALWAMVVAGLFGIDTRRSYAYQLFAILAVALVVALLVSRLRRPHGVHLERHLPNFATVGEPFRYRIRVRDGDASGQNLWLREHLRGKLADTQMLAEFADGLTPGARAVKRRFAFPRWLRLKRLLDGAETFGHEVCASVASGYNVELGLRPLRRGFIHFQTLDIGLTEPLGLARQIERRTLPGSVLVLPRRFPVATELLPGAGQNARLGGGLRQVPGSSDEFLGLRDYRPGDAVRYIHWKRSASLPEPVVREFHGEASQRHAVVLDGFGAQSGEPLFEAAICVAASLVEHGVQRLGGADLILTRNAVVSSATRHASLDALLMALATVAGDARGNPLDLVSSVLEHGAQIRGVVCVLTQWDDDRAQLMHRLISAGIETTAVLVIAQDSNTATSCDFAALAVRTVRLEHLSADLNTARPSEH